MALDLMSMVEGALAQTCVLPKTAVQKVLRLQIKMYGELILTCLDIIT